MAQSKTMEFIILLQAVNTLDKPLQEALKDSQGVLNCKGLNAYNTVCAKVIQDKIEDVIRAVEELQENILRRR
jgi:hypothetical protein